MRDLDEAIDALLETVPRHTRDLHRVRVFGPLVGPPLEHRNAGTPTVVYRAEGGHDSYDEGAFLAELVQVFDAREIATEDEYEAAQPINGQPFDLDKHLRKREAKKQ